MMNRYLKKIWFCLSVLFCFDRGSKVLYYHDVFVNKCYTKMGTPLSLFEKHIELIKKEGFEIVSNITKSNNQVMLCFDDGFQGVWDCRDYFVANNIFPTIFIAIDLLGSDNYLSKEEVLELQKMGFKFQCHSMSHADLTSCSDDELYQEIVVAKKVLADILNNDVDSLCFPKGLFSDKIVNSAMAAGYKFLYSSIPGNYFDEVLPFVVRRNLVQDTTLLELKSILYGAMSIFKKRYLRIHFKSLRNINE